MSCSALQRREQYDHQTMNKPLNLGTSNESIYSDSYADVQTAFLPSTSMAEFENKLMNQNPLMAKDLINRPHPDKGAPHAPFGDFQGPRDPTHHMFAKMRHDTCGHDTLQVEAINNDIQGVIEGYKPNQDKINVGLSSEEKMNNGVDEVIGSMYRDGAYANRNKRIVFPMNGVHFPLTRRQYYNPKLLGTNLLEGYGCISDSTGMRIFKLILVLILLGVLIYGLYCLYTNYSKEETPTLLYTKSVPAHQFQSPSSFIEDMIIH